MGDHGRCYADIAAEKFDDEGIVTETSYEQIAVEEVMLKLYKKFEKNASIDPELPILHRKHHTEFLKKFLAALPSTYECLDASRPWLCYWILNALWILNDMPDAVTLSNIVQFLGKCQHPGGGFGGGPGQHPHLAPTYATVNAISIIGTDEAYNIIDRSKLQKFLWSLKDVNGAFALHKGGEQDIRGAYLSASIAKMTNVYTESLFDKTAEWIVSCQSYEGGFAGYPGMEAHGGYTFCGVAALALLNRTVLCDTSSLLRWVANRQMRLEGGFQGRTNKLVDACYSFWQGAIFPIVTAILSSQGEANWEILESELFATGALQEYLLVCCQVPSGGLIDKPGKSRDIYHTCYALCGLCVAQGGAGSGASQVLGTPSNRVSRIHPVHNVPSHAAYNATHYFIRHPPPVSDKD